jgi:UDP-N-acetylglucosamine 2-epimerase (non-hydrolysing)
LSPSPRIVTVTGTRPETIKMAPVIRAIESAEDLESVLVVTGQHREMLDSALADLELTPAHDLDLMRPNQSAAGLVARALSGLADLFREVQPAMVLVHGDTGTCCAAAQAAFLEGIPVGHVEAGLRSGSLSEPFPEEGNRRIVDTIAQLLWAPTKRAARTLREEGLSDRVIEVTGNTAIDALLQSVEKARSTAWPALAEIPEDGRIVLVTAHRRESFGEPFRELCRGLRQVAEENPDVRIVYPVHLNPQVRAPVEELLAGHPRIHLLEPLPYLPFLALMDRSHLVLTDSGGLQEEAPALDKPVLVMRERTERQEAVDAGTVLLVGTSASRIAAETHRLLADSSAYRAMAEAANPFGDGEAAARIVRSIGSYLESAEPSPGP